MLVECSACGEGVTAAPAAWMAREAAKAEGYHVALPGGHDLCPHCWAVGWRIIRDGDAWVPFCTGTRTRTGG